VGLRYLATPLSGVGPVSNDDPANTRPGSTLPDGGIGTVALALLVAFGVHDIAGFVEIENRLALGDCPAPVAARPAVEIAAIDADLFELAVYHQPGGRVKIGLASRAIASERNHRIAHLVRVVDATLP